MNIKIQSINFSIDEKLKEFINKKVKKVVSIDDNILNANVFLRIEKPESHTNKVVEIKLHSSIGEYFAKKQCNSFEESADLAIQALRKQIIKHKER